MGEADVDRASSAQLIRWLVELAEGPWARWWASMVDHADKGDAHALDKAAASLASLLKPFHRPDGSPLKPHVVRLEDGTTPRGYMLTDFGDAFPRYLGSPGATSATSATALARDVAPVAPVAPPHQEDEPCARCERYGADHPGEHIADWEGR
jgi:hypothetical protein